MRCMPKPGHLTLPKFLELSNLDVAKLQSHVNFGKGILIDR